MTNQVTHVPKIVGWEITNRCNLSCPHCYSAAGRRSHDELTTAECRQLIDDMAKIGVQMIGWTGGEPLLRDDLEELTAYAGSLGIGSNVTTNGILLDEVRAESLIQSGIRAVQISLDGSTPEINHRIRGAGADDFKKIIEAIRICRKHGTRVVLATLVARENLNDSRDMIALAVREEVDAIRFCGFVPAGRGKRDDIRDLLNFTHEMGPLLEFVKEAQADKRLLTTFDASFGPVPPEYQFHKCIAGTETFYLKANGDLYPCTSLYDKRFKVGNIREHDLPVLWESPRMKEMSAFPRQEIKGACRSCDNFTICKGACRGTTLAYTGDLMASFLPCLYLPAFARLKEK